MADWRVKRIIEGETQMNDSEREWIINAIAQVLESTLDNKGVGWKHNMMELSKGIITEDTWKYDYDEEFMQTDELKTMKSIWDIVKDIKNMKVKQK